MAPISDQAERARKIVAELKAAKLAAQWPKVCGCGRIYEKEETPWAMRLVLGHFGPIPKWEALPFAYPYTDAFAVQEARHCPCGSTLVVLLEILDLNQE